MEHGLGEALIADLMERTFRSTDPGEKARLATLELRGVGAMEIQGAELRGDSRDATAGLVVRESLDVQHKPGQVALVSTRGDVGLSCGAGEAEPCRALWARFWRSRHDGPSRTARSSVQG